MVPEPVATLQLGRLWGGNSSPAALTGRFPVAAGQNDYREARNAATAWAAESSVRTGLHQRTYRPQPYSRSMPMLEALGETVQYVSTASLSNAYALF